MATCATRSGSCAAPIASASSHRRRALASRSSAQASTLKYSPATAVLFEKHQNRRLQRMEQLIPREELDSLDTAPAVIPRWVKYGSILTGAALLLARLGGIAYADGGGHGGHGGHGGSDHAKSGHGGDHGGHMATQPPAAPAAKGGSHHGGSARAARAENATTVKSAKSVDSAVVAGAVATAKSANTVAPTAAATAGTVRGDTAQSVKTAEVTGEK